MISRRLGRNGKPLRRGGATLAMAAALLVAYPVDVSADNTKAQQIWAQAQVFLQHNQIQAAMPYLLEAARQGNATAQTTLGNMYHDGTGVQKDDAVARQWYELAAAQGQRFAEYSLANMYMLGLGGLTVDQTKATALFELSAEKGLADAQEALGMSYELGRGTPHNRQKAIYWASKAVANGNSFAQVIVKILSNPHTPVFTTEGEVQSFTDSMMQYCEFARVPQRRPDLDRPGFDAWQHVMPNWKDSYCD
jgi:hypothetical protein